MSLDVGVGVIVGDRVNVDVLVGVSVNVSVGDEVCVGVRVHTDTALVAERTAPESSVALNTTSWAPG